jgi:hypothetical protein
VSTCDQHQDVQEDALRVARPSSASPAQLLADDPTNGQVHRIMEINQLSTITSEVVVPTHKFLVIGVR